MYNPKSRKIKQVQNFKTSISTESYMHDKTVSLSQNGSPRKVTPKKRKKKKSIVFKPHKYLKVKRSRSPKSSIPEFPSSDSIISCNEIKPSTSETDVFEESMDHESDSEISVSLNDQKFVCSDYKSDFDNSYYKRKRNSSTCRRNLSDNVNDSSNVSAAPSISLLSEFFNNCTSEERDSYSGDIDELIDGNYSEESDNVEKLTRENSNGNLSDDELNDSLDFRLNDLIEKEEDIEPTDSDNSELDYELIEVDMNYIVVLKYSQTVKIFGYCYLKVLLGKINILGYTLTSKSPEYCIYSPRGTALLTLTNTSNFCNELKSIKSFIPQLAKKSSLQDLIIRKDSSIIMLSKKNDFKLKLIENHISQWILPKKNIYPYIEIEPKGTWNTISVPEVWDKIVKCITSTSRVFICGGKGVGKSTFLRYAINGLIQKYGKIKVVDLDPGQSEFTVPGTISIVTVTEPLLGVNYTHLREADRSILCDISVSQDPYKYVQCIEELMNTDNHLCGNTVPMLINYMGYTNDIAFHLVASAITIIKPNIITYLRSDNRKKNFKIKMSKEKIEEYSQLFYPNSSKKFEMDIITISSPTDENTGWTLEPRQMREMCILAYFGQSMDENMITLQDYRLPMFEIDLMDISITDRNNVKVKSEAINANIVALCSLANDELSIFQCFGWGIVRVVDFISRRATIITPVDENVLEKVTHLVVGCLTLPPSVYMNHENVQGHVPYVMEGELIDFGQMSKRTHIPVNTGKK